ncbi:hypothetical protein B0H10DRAFT_2047298 [Mycena sp. CBHHK59/15]|nr:hypothetical protein B0H10DRAFT_2047298 [Mycena sp. CBHHK59/15]
MGACMSSQSATGCCIGSRRRYSRRRRPMAIQMLWTRADSRATRLWHLEQVHPQADVPHPPRAILAPGNRILPSARFRQPHPRAQVPP